MYFAVYIYIYAGHLFFFFALVSIVGSSRCCSGASTHEVSYVHPDMYVGMCVVCVSVYVCSLGFYYHYCSLSFFF
jgi:Ca2+/Na+ antiporter